MQTAELTTTVKQLLTFVSDSSGELCAEFKISIRSLPFLADHGFHNIVVLPGSFYIGMAVSLHQELSKHVPGAVRNVNFQNPVILSLDDTTIRIKVRNSGSTTAEYTFYETTGENIDTSVPHQYAAKLEVGCEPSSLQESVDGSFSIEEFQAQADDVIDSERFYKELRNNGNRYGPSFRCVSSVWRAGNQSLGRLSCSRAGSEPRFLLPILLDSATQLLAPFMMARDKTLIMQSIERIEIASLNFPGALWCHATLPRKAEGESNRVVGDVRVFDPSGKSYLELSGVTFTLLDRPQASDGNTALQLVVTSNITAEPLEDCLRFWAAYFNLQTKIQFASYDQIFQQLLQPDSAFHRNKTGVNIILLQLEKWAGAERNDILGFDKKRAERCFGERKRCVLPNGLEIVHLNRYETDYLYQEIFEHECYLRHGIRLPDGATVVDIGANIGLFFLFVTSRCRNPRIYAFEPAPVVYELLRANCDAYGADVRTFNSGVSHRQGAATFTFYENSSLFSGFYPDEAVDRETIRAVVRNMLSAESVAGESVQEYVNELTTDRLRRSAHQCRLTSVSDIIHENQIDRIDLLKIDAEKSELDIVRGIADCDWPKIDQIVIEIHDPSRETVPKIHDLLIRKGYRCAVEQEKLLERSGLFNLFATRDEIGDQMRSASERLQISAVPQRMARRLGSLQRNVRDFCAALQSFTSQTSVPLILCFCPASPAVKGDAAMKAAVREAEREVLSQAGSLAGVFTIGSESLLSRYPVAEYYDIHGHHLGDIPYTPQCYAAIGTAMFRTIFNLKRGPFKVIVLDCDNTLWKGICGEDGPLGVAVTEPHRVLQQFMLDQMNRGMLLCLCSKNSEQDVMDVFDQRTDMLLKREHIVSWRINWKNKSENIKSLANELNLALDSFVFVDDNPVDCADVEVNCPDVLTLRLPRNPASFASFLEHIWAFDHGGRTEEDRQRTRMYQDDARRERFREQTVSLNDFIAGLMVHVEIAQATQDQFSRISQLSYRTNQFNFTTVRRSPSEIADLLKRDSIVCLTARVADRFGDYGLVGVVVYEIEVDRFRLDTFLLSCRVLGRGVEHTILSDVGQRALRAGKKYVELCCLPTERNLPAREFLSSLGDQYRREATESWFFPAEYLASLRYKPGESLRPSNENLATPMVEKLLRPSTIGFGSRARSEQLQRIGDELYDISRVAKAINEFLRTEDPEGVAGPEPSSRLETMILSIWRKVLGRPGVGVNANFFEVGGTSLKAVQVVAMIRKKLKKNLSITSLFECPTVRLLAARLNAVAGSSSSELSTAGAALRGQQRRSKAMRGTKTQ